MATYDFGNIANVTLTGLLTAGTVQLTGGSGTQGTMSWNTDEETVDLILNGAVLQLGQELHGHVRNATGSLIANGTPVMFAGTLGASGRLKIQPMTSTVQATAKFILGLATTDIANDSDGKVTPFGKVRGLDTTGGLSFGGLETWNDEDLIYADAAHNGFLTNVEPTSGMSLFIGVVVNTHATQGTIYVRITPLDRNLYAELGGAAFTGAISISTGGLTVDDITEFSGGAGVLIETISMKDGEVTADSLILRGSSSGLNTIKAAAVAGGVTYVWPATDGSANHVLVTDGSGVLSFSAGGTAAAGSLTGTTLAANVVNSSLTLLGAVVNGAVPIMSDELKISGSATNSTSLKRVDAGTDYDLTFPNAAPTQNGMVAKIATSGNITYDYAITAVIWRITSDTATGTVNPIINWELADDTESEFYLGSATQVVESSGTFAFATTGHYRVDFGGRGLNASGAEPSLAANILSTDDNSTYTSIGFPADSGGAVSNTMNIYTTAQIRVQDITLDKIRFSKTSNHGSGILQGNTSNNRTFAVFTKLAEL